VRTSSALSEVSPETFLLCEEEEDAGEMQVHRRMQDLSLRVHEGWSPDIYIYHVSLHEKKISDLRISRSRSFVS
jgi:hypothetical protein